MRWFFYIFLRVKLEKGVGLNGPFVLLSVEMTGTAFPIPHILRERRALRAGAGGARRLGESYCFRVNPVGKPSARVGRKATSLLQVVGLHNETATGLVGGCSRCNSECVDRTAGPTRSSPSRCVGVVKAASRGIFRRTDSTTF